MKTVKYCSSLALRKAKIESTKINIELRCFEEELIEISDQIKPICRSAAARYIGIQVYTLRKLERNGTGPEFGRAGVNQDSRVVYRKPDIDEWLKTCVPRYRKKFELNEKQDNK